MSGLGRGLSALIKDTGETQAPVVQKTESEELVVRKTPVKNVKPQKESSAKPVSNIESEPEYKYIDITKIVPNPYQPRKEFDENAIEELAKAISKSGFITPLLVNKQNKDGEYVLVAGERRLRASKLLGLAEIPVVVKELTDEQMMQIAIIENVQRKNLNPIEEAKAYQNMLDRLNKSSQDIAEMLGLPSYYINQKLKLVQLPEVVQNYVANGELSEGAGIALLKLDSPDAMIAAAKIAVRQHMSRVSTEKLVEKILLSKGIKPSSSDYQIKARYQHFIDACKDSLGWNMKIKGGINGKGKIEIEFMDEMDFKGIYNTLEKVLK